MASPDFVHLHVHSAYSLLEGALTVARLAELAKADQQPAIALTDTDNMFGILEFSEKMAGSGIQPIAGLALAVDFAEEPGRRPLASHQIPRIVVLARSDEGYQSLMSLTSAAFLHSARPESPAVTLDVLRSHSRGLIALTGGKSGPIDRCLRQGQVDVAQVRLQDLKEVFGDDLYVEIQRHDEERESTYECQLLELAYQDSLPLVAAQEPFFARREDYEAHDALICIAEGRVLGQGDRRRLTPEYYFKTRAEMKTLFRDLPEALDHSVDIARRCCWRPKIVKPILPRYATDTQGNMDEASALRDKAQAGLIQRLKTLGLADGLNEEDYQKRLLFELDVIERMKFPGYFLIVADFIQWAKSQNIPVGPGRGSGAGSLVAYALTITDLDPMRFGLLFERFLNPERVSMPDFDIDFCQNRRDEVIRYVQQKYGSDRVAQIITFGSLQARGVLRDVGRVLEMPYGQVDRLCKMVPQNPANPVTLARALQEEPALQAARDAEQIVKQAFDISLKLEGLYRHASTHAAGIVIADRPLDQLVPLYRDPKSDMPVTQFNMKWVEQAGLVKFDFLGLKTLTVLRAAVDFLARKNVTVDLGALPLQDTLTFAMLGRGETMGVFQLESMGMRKALVDMKPDCFEDIIALVALYRPGPMANIPTYCARKHGKEMPEYIHPALEPMLRETFGVIIYQEQVMQIAQVLAGYSLGEADLLRRAMGKKIKSEMEAQRARFVSGCAKNDVTSSQAEAIFDLLAKFADYGFNKSHAATYALIAYQTAWLKAHHPVEFLAASMSLETTNTDKLSEFRAEAVRMGISVKPPCVNHSEVNFSVRDQSIQYALCAIKGVGEQAVTSLVARRHQKAFQDLSDFARRLDASQINRRVLEGLVCSGALDCLMPQRWQSFEAIDAMLAEAHRQRDNQTAGQNELFGGQQVPLAVPEASPWLPAERLQNEHDVIGFFLSGHPLDDYASVLARLRLQTWVEFCHSVKAGFTTGCLAGIVLSKAERRTKTGNRMGIVNISDTSGQYEAILFSEGLAQYRTLLEPGAAIMVQLSGEWQAEEVRARILTVEKLDDAVARKQKGFRIFMSDIKALPPVEACLKQKGDSEISLVMTLDPENAEVEVRLPSGYKISPQMIGALKDMAGISHIQEL